MPVNQSNYLMLLDLCKSHQAELIAVVKNRTIEDIQALYDLGQRKMAINRVQELVFKAPLLPNDIEWHIIGTLQRNKVAKALKYAQYIHSIDSIELLLAVEKQAQKLGIMVDVLLQVHIAREENKSGFKPLGFESVCHEIMKLQLLHTKIRGLMGMATYTDDSEAISREFHLLQSLIHTLRQIYPDQMTTLSMGMSHDYHIALDMGSTMLRIGSILFE